MKISGAICAALVLAISLDISLAGTTKWCPKSPQQICKMKCPEPECKQAGACAERQGCVAITYVRGDITKDCTDGKRTNQTLASQNFAVRESGRLLLWTAWSRWLQRCAKVKWKKPEKGKCCSTCVETDDILDGTLVIY